MAGKPAQAFSEQLVRNHQLARAISAPEFPLATFEMLQSWQRNRLERTYRDFLERESDAPACLFFLEELYGGMHFRERDQEVARVEPLMRRMLPGKAMHAMAESLKLQAISLEFDIRMTDLLQRHGIAKMDIPVYAEIYRECGGRPERENQILLIRKLGHELERLVKMPLLVRMLAALRGPARAAGFGRLQNFLENGMRSFRRLADPIDFVESIYQREWRAMNRLFSGHQNPFNGLPGQ